MYLSRVGQYVCMSIADTFGVKASCLLMMAVLISWLLGLFWTPWNSEGANTSEDCTVGKVPVRHLPWLVCVCMCACMYVCDSARTKMREDFMWQQIKVLPQRNPSFHVVSKNL